MPDERKPVIIEDRWGPDGAPTIRTSKTRSAVKLAEAMRASEMKLAPFRAQRLRFIREYAGHYYGDGTNRKQYLAMLYSLVRVLLPNVVVDPETMITNEDPALDAFVDVMRLNLNYRLRQMLFTDTMADGTVDSMFGMAVFKTGLGPKTTGTWREGPNWVMDPGKVYSGTISMDNWIVDMSAWSRWDISFEGNAYAVPLEWARATRLYQRGDLLEKAAKNQPAVRSEKVRDLSGRSKLVEDQYLERVELVDVWLPQENVQVTLPRDLDSAAEFIDERGYDGPEFGPYDHLCYARVPDNLIPIPPIAAVYDLHLLINEMARKIERQAKRQKDIGIYSEGFERDAAAIRTASDGDLVGVRDANEIKALSFGGVNQQNYQVMAWLRDFFNMLGGNPELVGGLGPQSNTLGQDELNRASAGTLFGFWRKCALDTAGRIARKVAWYEWTDPVGSRTLRMTLPGGASIPVRWSPEAREGQFLDYEIRISPFSKKSQDPEAQYQRLMTWLQSIVLPLAQIGAPMGRQLDVDAVVKLSGELLGVPEARALFRSARPMRLPRAGGGGKPRSAYGDNRVVRRLPAKPEPIESPAERAGVEV